MHSREIKCDYGIPRGIQRFGRVGRSKSPKLKPRPPAAELGGRSRTHTIGVFGRDNMHPDCILARDTESTVLRYG